MNGVTLFSGMGGSALGLKACGVRELYFNDFEKHAIDCLRQNFPGLDDACYDNRSIEDVKGKEVLDLIKLKKGELDFLQMSPPCTSFSNLNSNYDTKADADVNDLYSHGMRIVKETMPKVMIIENVPGFFSNSRVFFEALNDIDEAGYYCDGWVLDSAYYGCNQSRPRAWIVGYRKDFGKYPTKPKTVSKSTALKKIFPYISWMYLPQFEGLLLSSNRPMPTITKTPNIYFIDELEDVNKKLDGMGEASRENLQYDEEHIERIAQNPRDYNIRLPTVEELLVLSDVPKDYKMVGESYNKKWNRIGNMVLPKMMETLIRHILNELDLR